MKFKKFKKFYIPFIDEIRTEFADRQIWQYKLFRELQKVIDYFEKWSDNLFCIICQREHSSAKALRNCLWYHKYLTVNYFIDHELVEASSQ